MVKTVSVVVMNKAGAILALRRSDDRSWYPAKWDIISGKIEENESAKEAFLRELFEEIGLTNFISVESNNSYVYKEAGGEWLVYPFRCLVESDIEIRLNHEHSRYAWVEPKELLDMEHATPLRTELSVFFDL